MVLKILNFLQNTIFISVFLDLLFFIYLLRIVVTVRIVLHLLQLLDFYF